MSVRCSAHTTAGDPCGRWALEGASVCPSHGAGAPQVRAAAERRVLELVDPALAKLAGILDLEPTSPAGWAQVLRACALILDKAGIGHMPALHELPITRERVEAEIQRLEAGIAIG